MFEIDEFLLIIVKKLNKSNPQNKQNMSFGKLQTLHERFKNAFYFSMSFFFECSLSKSHFCVKYTSQANDNVGTI